jgi:hypothetical protein
MRTFETDGPLAIDDKRWLSSGEMAVGGAVAAVAANIADAQSLRTTSILRSSSLRSRSKSRPARRQPLVS